ncbi:MAG: Phosphoglycolate phosphatase [Methanomassiliicoccales archaeon PtaU1.Bin124]|nr:MAG: Phosphoglycolate phosphatase [Methanomassiliicoccales archaeon PtaU1.Bin124]
MIDTFIFDLDGTLVDSFHDILVALQGSAVDLGMEPPTEAEVRRKMHFRLDQLVRATFPDIPPEDVMVHFRRRYDGSGYPTTVPFPGVEGTIRSLKGRGCRMYVATNKRKVAADIIVSRLDVDGAIETVMTSDLSNPPMDKAEQVRRIMSLHGLEASRTALVGDTKGDWEAAEQTGVTFVLAAYGYGNIPAADARGKGVMVIDSFGDLAKLR